MRKFLLPLLVLAQASWAGTIVKKSFTINPNTGRNSSFYACDFVEGETEEVIEKLGGKVLRISCSGGINPPAPIYQPNFVRVKISRSEPVLGTTETITLKGSKNCHLVSEIVRGLKRAFPITKVSGLGSCFTPSQSYRIRITMKK